MAKLISAHLLFQYKRPDYILFTQCYKFVVGNHKNWHDARTHCINQGGNLLSITSEKEQGEWQECCKVQFMFKHIGWFSCVTKLHCNNSFLAFLTTQMLNYKEDFWIGMNDVNWEMRFVWTDGKSISYTNWALGEPASAPPGRYFHEVFLRIFSLPHTL